MGTSPYKDWINILYERLWKVDGNVTELYDDATCLAHDLS